MNAVKLIVDVGAEEEHAFVMKSLPLTNAVLGDNADQMTRWCVRLTAQAGVPDDVEIVKNHERELREDIDCWRKSLDWSALGTPLAVTRQLWGVIDDETDLAVTRGRLTMRWTVCLVAVLARLAVKDERLSRLEQLVYQAEIERVLS